MSPPSPLRTRLLLSTALMLAACQTNPTKPAEPSGLAVVAPGCEKLPTMSNNKIAVGAATGIANGLRSARV